MNMERKKFYYRSKEYKIIEIDKTQKDLLCAVFRLRHKVYCDELHWVESRYDNMEIDAYDEQAIHFAAVNEHGDVLGTSRILSNQDSHFMVDKEFSILIDKKFSSKLNTSDHVEISRLAMYSNFRQNKDKKSFIVNDLYLAMYVWSLVNKKKYWIIVVENAFLKFLKKKYFLPVQLLGKSHTYPDGVMAVAALINIRSLRFLLLFCIKPRLFFIFIKMYITYGFK